jgi:hypothetical protein
MDTLPRHEKARREQRAEEHGKRWRERIVGLPVSHKLCCKHRRHDQYQRRPTRDSFSITMRLHTALDHGLIGAIATAVSNGGGIVTAIDVADSRADLIVVDVTCSAIDPRHAQELVTAVRSVEGIEVHKVSDRTFLLHLGGKIEVRSKFL